VAAEITDKALKPLMNSVRRWNAFVPNNHFGFSLFRQRCQRCVSGVCGLL